MNCRALGAVIVADQHLAAEAQQLPSARIDGNLFFGAAAVNGQILLRKQADLPPRKENTARAARRGRGDARR